MRSQPLVSFVTPVYNGATYLAECIESVLNQEYSNWEYIILDNNSSDATGEIIKRYASQDKRIRIYRNDTTLPIMANWNAALEKISPESRYCKVVHADDRLFPRCTRKMVDVAERHPSAGLIGAYSKWGNRVACDGLPWHETFVDGREIASLSLLGGVRPFLSPSALLIRSDLIRAKREYYPGHEIHADVRACYEVMRTADFGFVHEVLTFIRRHDGSVTATQAEPLEAYRWTELALFVEYGPLFLREEEYRRRLAARWFHYVTFIAQSTLERQSREFLRFHCEGLQKLGLPVSGMRLARTVLRECIYNL